MNINNCTCGPYSSILPPEPCPIHDPERAYWRMKLLQEFGGQYSTTTTTVTANTVGATKSLLHDAHWKKDKPDPIVHLAISPGGTVAMCGVRLDDDKWWAGTIRYTTCENCKRQAEIDGRQAEA